MDLAAVPESARPHPPRRRLRPCPFRRDRSPFKPLVLGIDEYQMYLYEVLADGRTAFFKAADGSFAQQMPATSALGGGHHERLAQPQGDYVALGTGDGRVACSRSASRPSTRSRSSWTSTLAVRDRGLVELDPAQRPIREVAYEETRRAQDGGRRAGRRRGAGLAHGRRGRPSTGPPSRPQDGERVTHVRIGRSDTLIASTEKGNLYHWELAPEVAPHRGGPRLREPITALEYILGGITAIVGDAKGNLGGWFRVRLKDEDTELQFVKAHTYPPQGVAIARHRAPAPATRAS